MKTQYSNLLEGITEIFPTFVHISFGLENFSIADAKTTLHNCKICENQCNKSHNFCIYCPIWVSIKEACP
jgi:hypothetical protein